MSHALKLGDLEVWLTGETFTAASKNSSPPLGSGIQPTEQPLLRGPQHVARWQSRIPSAPQMTQASTYICSGSVVLWLPLGELAALQADGASGVSAPAVWAAAGEATLLIRNLANQAHVDGQASRLTASQNFAGSV